MSLQINPALDIEYLAQFYGDDPTIIHMIFDAFLSDSMPRWKSLENEVQNSNLSEAASIVHGLKPSFTMTGLTIIRKKVDLLEASIKSKAEISKIKALYDEISEELDFVLPVIEEESARLKQLY